jgi:hypothetical protein
VPNADTLLERWAGRDSFWQYRTLRPQGGSPGLHSYQPVRYQELHAGIVPEDVRRTQGYLGYELSVKTAKTIADFTKEQFPTFFNEAFTLVADAE